MKPILTVDSLIREAGEFAEIESTYNEPALYGVTDGKAIGTYLEHKFKNHLMPYTSMNKVILLPELISLACMLI